MTRQEKRSTEDTDGELHPAVDGQSLGERYDSTGKKTHGGSGKEPRSAVLEADALPLDPRGGRHYKPLRRFDCRVNQLELNGSREPVVAVCLFVGWLVA